MIPYVFTIYVFLSIIGGLALFLGIDDLFEKLSKENVGSEFHQPLTKWEKFIFFIHWVGAFLFGAALHHVNELSDLLIAYRDLMSVDRVFNLLHSLNITIFICCLPYTSLVINRASKLLKLKEKKD